MLVYVMKSCDSGFDQKDILIGVQSEIIFNVMKGKKTATVPGCFTDISDGFFLPPPKCFCVWLLTAWSCRWPAHAQSEFFHTRWLDELPLAKRRLQTQ